MSLAVKTSLAISVLTILVWIGTDRGNDHQNFSPLDVNICATNNGGCGANICLNNACITGQCTLWGDPHVVALWGQKFDYQGIGDYTLVRTYANAPAALRNIYVQSRFKTCLGSPTCVVAVGVRDNATMVAYAATASLPASIRLDNTNITLVQGHFFCNTSKLCSASSPCTICYQRELGLDVIVMRTLHVVIRYYNIFAAPSSATVNIFLSSQLMNQVSGLCGAWNNPCRNSTCLQKPDGAYTTQINPFGMSWQILPGNFSVFDYNRKNEDMGSVNPPQTPLPPPSDPVFHGPEIMEIAMMLCQLYAPLTYEECLLDCSYANDVQSCVQTSATTYLAQCLASGMNESECTAALNPPATCPNACSYRGVCNETTNECDCACGYGAEDCSVSLNMTDTCFPIRNYTCPDLCSGNGVCGQFGVCNCTAEFTGLSCNISVNACAVNGGGCAANATCIPTGVALHDCQCDEGFCGDGFNFCNWAGAVCDTGNGGCDANAECVAGNHTCDPVSCFCNAGYAGDGFSCFAVNACLTSGGGCDAHAFCFPTGPGTRNCTCSPGYTGNGFSCSFVNDTSLSCGVLVDGFECEVGFTSPPGCCHRLSDQHPMIIVSQTGSDIVVSFYNTEVLPGGYRYRAGISRQLTPMTCEDPLSFTSATSFDTSYPLNSLATCLNPIVSSSSSTSYSGYIVLYISYTPWEYWGVVVGVFYWPLTVQIDNTTQAVTLLIDTPVNGNPVVDVHVVVNSILMHCFDEPRGCSAVNPVYYTSVGKQETYLLRITSGSGSSASAVTAIWLEDLHHTDVIEVPILAQSSSADHLNVTFSFIVPDDPQIANVRFMRVIASVAVGGLSAPVYVQSITAAATTTLASKSTIATGNILLPSQPQPQAAARSPMDVGAEAAFVIGSPPSPSASGGFSVTAAFSSTVTALAVLVCSVVLATLTLLF